MTPLHLIPPRKKFLNRFVERTLKRETLGFEAYVWAAHRVSGLLLLAFLILHLLTLSSVFQGEIAYDRIMRSMDRPLVKTGEIFLLWVALFHGLNGLRLILFNLMPAVQHRGLAYGVTIASFVLAVALIPFVL